MKHYEESEHRNMNSVPIFYSIGKGKFNIKDFLDIASMEGTSFKWNRRWWPGMENIAFGIKKSDGDEDVDEDDEDVDYDSIIIVVDVNNKPHQLIEKVAKDIHCEAIETGKFSHK